MEILIGKNMYFKGWGNFNDQPRNKKLPRIMEGKSKHRCTWLLRAKFHWDFL